MGPVDMTELQIYLAGYFTEKSQNPSLAARALERHVPEAFPRVLPQSNCACAIVFRRLLKKQLQLE